jgi:hypothetical protein
MMRFHLMATVVCMLGCGQPPEPKPTSPTSIDAPSVSPMQESTTPEVTPAPEPADEAAPVAAPEPPAQAQPPAAAEKQAPPKGVTVKSIGMHIGGGPNDAAAKAPFTKTIEGGFPDFVACAAHLPPTGRKGTFGVDLLVKKDGGTPDVSSPRTGLPGEPFKACVVQVFERLVFEKPKRGATKLSYSLRFDSE